MADGRYDKHLLEDYSAEDFARMDSFLQHDRDLSFSYAAVKTARRQIPVQNRVSGEMYESAQFLYILIAACLFAKIRACAPFGFYQTFLRCRPPLKFLCLRPLWRALPQTRHLAPAY